jgi:hypothetical protein
MKIKYPYILLICLSPFVAEFLSGSSPFFTFFSPFVFAVYLGFYGLGALLIRELVAHKKYGYASVVLLGAAFGILEEGIILKSWFDPTWMGAQITSQALRVYGVSVLQPFANVVYHAVISITAPIVLVDSLSSRAPWLSTRKVALCGVFFGAAAVLLSTFNYDYKIGALQYIVGIIPFGVCVVLGLKGITVPGGTKVYTPLGLWFLGSLFVVLLFSIFYALTNAGISWIIIIILALLLYTMYGRAYARVRWEPRTYYASAAGFISGLLPIVAIMARTSPQKVLNFVGTLIFTVLLIIVYKKVFQDNGE